MDTIEQAYSDCMDAIWDDDLDRLKDVLAKVPQVVLHHDGLGTLLHSAISDGENIEFVRLLVDAGSDINAIAPIGGNALCKAVRCKNPERSFQLVALLLERGAELALDPHCNALIRAVNSNNVQAVQSLLSAGYDPHYTFRNLSGSVRNALSLAVVQGRTEIADMLRAAGCQMPREEDVAIDLSMANEEPASRKVGEEVPVKQSSEGSRMPEESKQEFEQVLSLLPPVFKADQSEQLSHLLNSFPSLLRHDETAGGLLHDAIRFNSPRCVELLIERGADVDRKAKMGSTPLCLAASKGAVSILHALLSGGARLQTAPQENALLSCISGNQIEACRILLDAGYDPHYTFRTLSGNLRNALSFAVEQGRTEIAEMLRAAGCQMPREEDVAIDLCPANEEKVAPEVGEAVPAEESSDESSDELSMSAKIYDAISEDDVERLKSLLRQAKLSEIRDDLVHDAANLGSMNVLRYLIEAGRDINKLNELDESPLYLAVSSEHFKATELLLEKGAIFDYFPDTNPLLEAIALANPRILRLLLEKGGNAHFTFRGISGRAKNALSFAIECGNEEIIELLKAAGCQMPREEDVALDLFVPKKVPVPERCLSDEDRETILDMMAGEFGDVEPHALQEIVPVDADVEVRVHVIPAGDESPFLTIFTTGMSARPMTVPEGSEEFEYAELLMHLPGDWKWKESLQEDSPYSWPFQWLRNIAYLPHLNETWLGGPHTIIASDEPPVSLGVGTDFTCLLLVADLIDCAPIELPSGRTVRVYTVVPIFTDERDFELREGVVALLTKFQKLFIPAVCLPGRPSVAMIDT